MRIAIAFILAVGSFTAARAEPALSGNVLVWADAKLYLDPDDHAPWVELGVVPHGRKPENVGLATAMRVVGTKGSFVEVVPPSARSCAPVELLAGVDQPHLFVHRDDLAPVLVRAWSGKFDDGSRVTLDPGTPVVPADDGNVAVRAGKLTFRVAVPAGSIGSSYPGKPIVDPGDHPGWYLHTIEGVHVAGTTIDVTEDDMMMSNTASHPTKGQTRLALRVRCVTLEITVPDAAVATWKPLKLNTHGGILGTMGSTGDQFPAGTVLSTRSGRVVGKAINPVEVATTEPDGKRACGAVQFWPAADTGLPVLHSVSRESLLCAPSSKVQRSQFQSLTGTGDLNEPSP